MTAALRAARCSRSSNRGRPSAARHRAGPGPPNGDPRTQSPLRPTPVRPRYARYSPLTASTLRDNRPAGIAGKLAGQLKDAFGLLDVGQMTPFGDWLKPRAGEGFCVGSPVDRNGEGGHLGQG